MLCKRIISVLTFNKGSLCRTKKFNPDYFYTANFLDFWLADEIVALNITRDAKDQIAFYEKLVLMSKQCFVPMAAGGGIRNMKDVDRLFNLGVDKIILNTYAIENPYFIGEVAQKYGAQAVVIAIDAKKNPSLYDGYRVYKDCGSTITTYSPQEWAAIAEQNNAGEIMITSIDHDGSLQGYDAPLCQSVINSVGIPVIVSGGAGNWKHFEEGINDIKADAVATTNIYHFTEESMLNAKKYLSSKNIFVRT